MSEKEQTHLYNPVTSEYSYIFKSHNDENDIVDTINAELFNTTNIGDVIRIRNEQNDDLFPFNAAAFIKWFEINPTHPMTREHLGYLHSRIEFKKKCIEQLPPKEFQTITLEYNMSLLAEFQILMLKRHSEKIILSPEENLKLLECQSYLDLSTWETANYIFTDMNFSQAKTMLQSKPTGSWLIRKSSQHHNIMKNAEIVVVAYKHIEKVLQVRLLYVHGVGWYRGNERMPLTSFRLLKESGCLLDYVTLCHAAESFFETATCHVDKLIKPPSKM